MNRFSLALGGGPVLRACYHDMNVASMSSLLYGSNGDFDFLAQVVQAAKKAIRRKPFELASHQGRDLRLIQPWLRRPGRVRPALRRGPRRSTRYIRRQPHRFLHHSDSRIATGRLME